MVLRVQWLETLEPVRLISRPRRCNLHGMDKVLPLKGISSHGELKTITVKALYKYLSKNPNVLVGANLNDKW